MAVAQCLYFPADLLQGQGRVFFGPGRGSGGVPRSPVFSSAAASGNTHRPKKCCRIVGRSILDGGARAASPWS
jgi:hypothetical protein